MLEQHVPHRSIFFVCNFLEKVGRNLPIGSRGLLESVEGGKPGRNQCSFLPGQGGQVLARLLCSLDPIGTLSSIPSVFLHCSN